MEPETFPSFEQSGPFRQWHRSYLAGVYGSEEVSLRCLKAARYIYAEMQKEWEADTQKRSRNDGMGLVS
jgi:hypothetical protein